MNPAGAVDLPDPNDDNFVPELKGYRFVGLSKSWYCAKACANVIFDCLPNNQGCKIGSLDSPYCGLDPTVAHSTCITGKASNNAAMQAIFIEGCNFWKIGRHPYSTFSISQDVPLTEQTRISFSFALDQATAAPNHQLCFKADLAQVRLIRSPTRPLQIQVSRAYLHIIPGFLFPLGFRIL